MISALRLKALAMGLSEITLGKYLEQSNVRNSSGRYGLKEVRGISTSKVFIPTKANLQGVSLANYKIVSPRQFAYVPDTSRRNGKISLAYNDSSDCYLVSSISIVFGIKPESIEVISPDFLFLLFNRPEFDRFARFNSWGSAREAFDWNALCETSISLPIKKIQEKYVAIYQGLKRNVCSLEAGIEQLQNACSICMENLISSYNCEEIGQFLHPVERRNHNHQLGLDSVRGISNTKEIMQTTKATTGLDVIGKFYVINPGEFVYNPRTDRMGGKVGVVFNNTDKPLLFSFNNLAFGMNEGMERKVLPDYLFAFFRRAEFDRFARVNSWGSATELFNLEDLGRYRIPIPDIATQQALVDLFRCFYSRKELASKLRDMLNNICPILIRGAIEEGRN